MNDSRMNRAGCVAKSMVRCMYQPGLRHVVQKQQTSLAELALTALSWLGL